MTKKEESRELTCTSLRKIVEEIINDAPDLGLDLSGGVVKARRDLEKLRREEGLFSNDHVFWGRDLLLSILFYRRMKKQCSNPVKQRSA